jgi:transcriptional regulator with XRE-family HTH domain
MPSYPRINGVGPLIRKARESRGLSLTELATELGIRPNYLSMVEHGIKRISGDRLYKIAAALEVTDSERNRWMAAAEHIPSDLWALLVRNPDRWEEIYALLRKPTARRAAR